MAQADDIKELKDAIQELRDFRTKAEMLLTVVRYVLVPAALLLLPMAIYGLIELGGMRQQLKGMQGGIETIGKHSGAIPK